jgi:hypothetical protein
MSETREDAFSEWWHNVILPAGTREDVAYEAFCAGWEAQRERIRRLAVERGASFLTLVDGAGVMAGDFADLLEGQMGGVRERMLAAEPALLRGADWNAAKSATDVPHLLAAVEAVLDMHRPGHIKLLGSVCQDHEAFPHFSITSTEADRVRACAACAATVCVTCTCGYVEFDRCPHRAAISSAILPSAVHDTGENQ